MINKQVKIEKPIYPKPDPVAPVNITAVVVTREKLSDWQEGSVIIGYDDQDFLTLSQWLHSILNHIKSLNDVIDQYEADAKEHNDSLAPGNFILPK